MRSMVSISTLTKDGSLSRIKWIQTITILWMSVEAAVSLSAAWLAHSPALLAFGGDSAIELASAMIVLWEFSGRTKSRRARPRAARLAGALLVALAIYVALISALSLFGHNEPRPTRLGMAILVAAAGIMPLLAHQKRKLSAETGSAALRADAAQSGLCAYLSLIALAGLATNTFWHISWADPLAALAITPLILWEAKESFRGKSCGCCSGS
jgi:divalent metal cation (Fe/Co/Zn/Cd) transporter